ncbi:MAG: DUF2892 domain-containing protein [Rhodocyclaceae bacterium]|nr:DUF2892 domain-containing protein [Rhodocyclaceae bacterium]
MKTNVGGVDRIFRLTSGVALVAWVTLLGGPAWAWIGIVPLLTGGMGFCPLYTLVNMSTCAGCKDDK